MESKIVFNISLAGDLNMRNFEALLFNRIHISDRIEDQGKLTEDWSPCFFKRDLSDIAMEP